MREKLLFLANVNFEVEGLVNALLEEIEDAIAGKEEGKVSSMSFVASNDTRGSYKNKLTTTLEVLRG